MCLLAQDELHPEFELNDVNTLDSVGTEISTSPDQDATDSLACASEAKCDLVFGNHEDDALLVDALLVAATIIDAEAEQEHLSNEESVTRVVDLVLVENVGSLDESDEALTTAMDESVVDNAIANTDEETSPLEFVPSDEGIKVAVFEESSPLEFVPADGDVKVSLCEDFIAIEGASSANGSWMESNFPTQDNDIQLATHEDRNVTELNPDDYASQEELNPNVIDFRMQGKLEATYIRDDAKEGWNLGEVDSTALDIPKSEVVTEEANSRSAEALVPRPDGAFTIEYSAFAHSFEYGSSPFALQRNINDSQSSATDDVSHSRISQSAPFEAEVDQYATSLSSGEIGAHFANLGASYTYSEAASATPAELGGVEVCQFDDTDDNEILYDGGGSIPIIKNDDQVVDIAGVRNGSAEVAVPSSCLSDDDNEAIDLQVTEGDLPCDVIVMEGRLQSHDHFEVSVADALESVRPD